MRNSKPFPIFALILGVGSFLIALACTPDIFIGGPSQTVVQTTGGNPGPSPSPGSDGTIAIVKIGAFGQSCPSGIEPAAGDRQVRVGCSMAITCTPKDALGNLLPPAVTGLAPSFFGPTSGAQFVRAVPWDDEAFNLNALGTTAGTAFFKCTVKGVSSDAWDLQVIP